MKTDQAAIEILREKGRTSVWYGDPDLIGDIAERAGYKPMHPLNRSAAVVGCLAKSTLFECKGFVQHLGRRYNVYSPLPPSHSPQKPHDPSPNAGERETTTQRAARVLEQIEPVRYISVFGERLLASGVLQAEHPDKQHSRQGLALLAGKWLRRMQRAGLAREGLDGWVTTHGPAHAWLNR